MLFVHYANCYISMAASLSYFVTNSCCITYSRSLSSPLRSAVSLLTVPHHRVIALATMSLPTSATSLTATLSPVVAMSRLAAKSQNGALSLKWHCITQRRHVTKTALHDTTALHHPHHHRITSPNSTASSCHLLRYRD